MAISQMRWQYCNGSRCAMSGSDAIRGESGTAAWFRCRWNLYVYAICIRDLLSDTFKALFYRAENDMISKLSLLV